MANHTTKSITIYQKTYQLPVLEGDSFQQIQRQIKQRQHIIKNEKLEIIKQKIMEKKSFFGLTSKSETIPTKKIEDLTFEEQFQELERLITDYDKLIVFLTQHKFVYQQFFAQLTNDLKDIVKEKLQESMAQERERLQLLNDENDVELIKILEGQKQQILANVWLFGKAFLLMLKKIELINKGIEQITLDQDTQKELLIEIIGRLGKYKKIYDLQKKINQSGKEAEKMTDTAINFEQYLHPFIGLFQGLINQVCEQDNNLSGTVNEIQSLVEDIMLSKTGSFMSTKADELSKNMLDFLIANEQKKERLIVALDEAQQEGIDWSWQQIDIKDCGDLTNAIIALQSHIDSKLGEYNQVSIIPTQNATDNSEIDVDSEEFQWEEEEKNSIKEDLGNGVILELVKIPTGEFMMGSNNAEDEKPIHKVELKGFYMSKYPITQAQYEAIMDINPSHFKGKNNPVESVSWDMAQKFCQNLSKKIGKKYQLPSESQWEYACRSGNNTNYCFGDDENQLGEYAWYHNNSNSQTHPVGEKKPNQWGLYDMHGNVWEWCEDAYTENYLNALDEGTSHIDKNIKYKCLRGGSWCSISKYCCSTSRYRGSRIFINYGHGFRVIYTLSETT